jgi:hypothetical protein
MVRHTGRRAAPVRRAALSLTARIRLWLERGEFGYFLRDAASGEPLRWTDPRIRVVPLAGSSYRLDALQNPAFDPGRRLALVPEPENTHDPNAIAVWDAERTVQGGYVPAEVAPELVANEQALSLWEYRDGGKRIGLRVLIAPADAWIQDPRR